MILGIGAKNEYREQSLFCSSQGKDKDITDQSTEFKLKRAKVNIITESIRGKILKQCVGPAHFSTAVINSQGE